jgi:hypothetical protein
LVIEDAVAAIAELTQAPETIAMQSVLSTLSVATQSSGSATGPRRNEIIFVMFSSANDYYQNYRDHLR